MDSLNRYAYHIDDIRKQKGMTVKQISEGICNERTYRRYIYGERKLPQNKLLDFCNRLEISPTDFYHTFLEKDKQEFQKIYRLYYLLLQGKKEEYKEEVMKINPKYLVNKMNIKLYEYVTIKYQYQIKSMSMYSAYDKYKRILNYPKCINNNIFDFADVIILDTLARIESELANTDKQALKLLHRILLDEKVRYITSEGKNVLASIYATVSLLYLESGEMVTSLQLAEEGIKYSHKLAINLALTNLYYTKAIALYNMGYRERSYLEAAKCLSNIISLENNHHFSVYGKLFKSKIKLDESSLLEYYIKNK